MYVRSCINFAGLDMTSMSQPLLDDLGLPDLAMATASEDLGGPDPGRQLMLSAGHEWDQSAEAARRAEAYQAAELQVCFRSHRTFC